jgi:hypothetical protein
MRESMAYRIVAIQRQASNRAPEPDVAILLSSQDGVYWRVPLAVIKETTGDNAYNLIGQSLRLRGKPLRYVAPYKFGDLIDICDITSEPKPPRFFKNYHPPYSHATEPSTIKAEGVALKIPLSSLDKCKRCNWASITIQNILQGKKATQKIEVTCHRDACPEHPTG